ncbi:T9SS type A sorting domain-containing protein [Prolixibacteraceae bacterium Z1-6]|uniref:T9SS type A sorting domain-containing protein n=1 Tax=Draconibacterium aestuarii TaxID=2998507 RepID=A0A9X3J5J1_9BACT|nr:T9SS type A sorting domain-containing protein [Prolixibacteraceae bacterium Z1-6]
MKGLLFLGILFFIISHCFAQEVQFPPAVLPAGGGVVHTNTNHISKWRIGEVNVLYIETEDLKSSSLSELADSGLNGNGEIAVYPNPVREHLNVQFNIDVKKEIYIEVTDIAGSKVFINQKQIVFPNQIVQLDFSGLTPALYLVNAYSSNQALKAIFKVEKH